MRAWFPELERFGDARQGRKAMANAEIAMFSEDQGHRAIKMHVMVMLAACASLAVAFALLFPKYGFRFWWVYILLWLLISIAIGNLSLYLRRRSIQRQLRRQLNDGGVPICMDCGYDLTGNASGRCPECGTPCAARVS